MRCSLVCESTPFFFLIIRNILPMSGQLSSNFEIRTFPMNPVPPVTRTFFLENQSAIDGNSEAIFEKTENCGAKCLILQFGEERARAQKWSSTLVLRSQLSQCEICCYTPSHQIARTERCFLSILLEMKLLLMSGGLISENPAESHSGKCSETKTVIQTFQ